jgi:hypothetical protein
MNKEPFFEPNEMIPLELDDIKVAQQSPASSPATADGSQRIPSRS